MRLELDFRVDAANITTIILGHLLKLDGSAEVVYLVAKCTRDLGVIRNASVTNDGLLFYIPGHAGFR
jgi:hypothetical protein